MSAKLPTGYYSAEALTSLKTILLFMRKWSEYYHGRHANTSKFYAGSNATAGVSQNGEVTIEWPDSWKINNYPPQQRIYAIVFQLKDWLAECQKVMGTKHPFSPYTDAVIEWNDIKISIKDARFWYEVLLRRPGLASHFGNDYVQRMRGVPIDPIRQQMIGALIENLKETVEQKSSDIRGLRRQLSDEVSELNKKYNELITARRQKCSEDYTNVCAQIQELCPGYKIPSIYDISSREW